MGFGKTACVLALVSHSKENDDFKIFSPPKIACNLVNTRATLVVVPNHLLTQWQGEVRKFTGTSLRVIVVTTMVQMPTVGEIKFADIVIISSRLWESDAYQKDFFGHNWTAAGTRFLNDEKNGTDLGGVGGGGGGGVGSSSKSVTSKAVRQYADFASRARCRDLAYLADVKKIRATVSTKENNDRMLPLEQFFWHRLVIDEAHELANEKEESAASDSGVSKDIWALPIRSLLAQARWCLTGTPPTNSLADMNKLGLILGVNLGDVDTQVTEDFVKTFMRSSRLVTTGVPRPVERQVYVKLNAEEMALYLQHRFEKESEIAAGQPRALEEIFQVNKLHYYPVYFSLLNFLLTHSILY